MLRSDKTFCSDVLCSSEVAGLSSSETVVSLHALNNKENTRMEAIDPNTCYMCFGSYEDDVCNEDEAAWVSCYCVEYGCMKTV